MGVCLYHPKRDFLSFIVSKTIEAEKKAREQ